MNAAIRAVVRCGIARGWEVYGVHQGYAGLIAGDFRPMTARTVGGIMQLGGTVLGSARSPEFKTEDGRMKALWELRQLDIEAAVVIGGNGSQTGANALAQMGFPVVGVASTIDNDLVGSDMTIGVDTALNIALEALDRLKTTASSHQRAIMLEVMGRNCGYLALVTGIAGGAEAILIPEIEVKPEEVVQIFRHAYERGKPHAVAVVAEGAPYNAAKLAVYFTEHKARIGYELRTTTLGYVQRGGAPTAYDRLLASRLGAGAVDALARGEAGVLVGLIQGRVTTTPLEKVAGLQKPINPELFELAKVLDT
jgi:6-phosphofructokinase 1